MSPFAPNNLNSYHIECIMLRANKKADIVNGDLLKNFYLFTLRQRKFVNLRVL